MNALRSTHAALVPGGWLLDVHPVPPSGRVEADGEQLGRLRERAFFDVVRATERELERVVGEGMFRRVRRIDRDIVSRYASADHLLEWVSDSEDVRIPSAVRTRVVGARGPIDVVERITFRLFEAR